ncbi:MAG: hypothetical protein ACREJC_22460 [Tepidisphaeraceae bacterium]
MVMGRNGHERHSMLRFSNQEVSGRWLPEPVYQCERGERVSQSMIDGALVTVYEAPCEYRERPIPAIRVTRGDHMIADYRDIRPRGNKPGQNVPEGEQGRM